MQRYTHYEESDLKNPLHKTQHNNSYVEFMGIFLRIVFDDTALPSKQQFLRRSRPSKALKDARSYPKTNAFKSPQIFKNEDLPVSRRLNAFVLSAQFLALFSRSRHEDVAVLASVLYTDVPEMLSVFKKTISTQDFCLRVLFFNLV